MNKIEISLKKLNGLVVPSAPEAHDNMHMAITIQANVMDLGFVFTRDLLDALAASSEATLSALYAEMLPVLRQMVGAHVRHRPMYPNFPQQVIEMRDMELHLNALLHYWTYGAWLPEYEEKVRSVAFEKTKFKKIRLVSDEEFNGILSSILLSRDSVDAYDKKVVQWFLENTDVPVPTDIPFKENLCLVAAHYLKLGKDLSEIVTNTTDVLRVCTHLSGGDVSLSTNTKFRSFKRSERRNIVAALEQVISAEDIKRHGNKWVRLAHALHVGDYSRKVHDVLKLFRENESVETFGSKVHLLVNNNQIEEASKLLLKRPSEFARRLDDMLCRVSKAERADLVARFGKVCDQVPTRILLQLYGHLNSRNNGSKRFIFPKGSTQKAILLPAKAKRLDPALVDRLRSIIDDALMTRFAGLPAMGKVYLDDALKGCPLPTQQRSASEGLFTVARGTRLPMGDKDTLRFFIYWSGDDIDLSGSFHDENFRSLRHISYTNLRDAEIQSYHSGDIVSAPKGASEFIDVDIKGALEHGVRYVVMNVFVFTGPTFAEHDTCFAGWMTREHPNSNEIFDAKTVEQKVDLRTRSKNSIPAVFDLKKREVIWCDLATKSNYWGDERWTSGNNIEGNRATVRDMLEMIVTMDNKVSLHHLLGLHAAARGTLVDDASDADVVFDLSTAYETNRINSEFMV